MLRRPKKFCHRWISHQRLYEGWVGFGIEISGLGYAKSTFGAKNGRWLVSRNGAAPTLLQSFSFSNWSRSHRPLHFILLVSTSFTALSKKTAQLHKVANLSSIVICRSTSHQYCHPISSLCSFIITRVPEQKLLHSGAGFCLIPHDLASFPYRANSLRLILTPVGILLSLGPTPKMEPWPEDR